MGGRVAALSETAPVRIGFGKIDSAPTGPIVSTVAPAPVGLVFTNGGPPGSVASPANAGDVNLSQENGSEHSSLPTRALWIGNIPGTTSSAALLQIFSPFGPVESARVLMHKVRSRLRIRPLQLTRVSAAGSSILSASIPPFPLVMLSTAGTFSAAMLDSFASVSRGSAPSLQISADPMMIRSSDHPSSLSERG